MDITKLPEGKKIILFDGVCNLCNSFVQYVINRDKKDQFRFAALQSDLGQEILQHIGVDTSSVDSIVLYEPGRAYYVKSDAALEIGRNLSGVSFMRSEEHTSELQSRENLVCRLLLEKKNLTTYKYVKNNIKLFQYIM